MSSDLGGQAASVRFENVTKAFGEVVAVDDVSIEIDIALRVQDQRTRRPSSRDPRAVGDLGIEEPFS